MGRKVGLTLDDVLEAAIAVADARGFHALTLTDVAERLGIRVPSLYNHVAGLAGLQRELRLRAAADLTTVLEQATDVVPARAALRSLAHAYRSFARQHPGLYEALQRAVEPGEDDEVYAALLRPVGVVAGVLRPAGLDERDAVPAIRALRAMLHGFVDLERRQGFGLPHDIDESFETAVEIAVDGLLARAPAPASSA